MSTIAYAQSFAALLACTVLQALVYAWIFPATTMAIAGWVDGHLLGRAIGVVAVATKLSPSLMSETYRHIVDGSWSDCYLVAAGVFGTRWPQGNRSTPPALISHSFLT